jgi:hypothetical protein
VADAVEAGGKHMQQEPAHELLRRERLTLWRVRALVR